jgi:DNA topoisomerase-1
MAKNLVIVESPAKAKTLNKYLGKDYEVTASMGHVRDLPKSKFGIDVDNKFEPSYVIIQKARKTVNALKKKASKCAVWLAADPDREGEAISWHLAHILKDATQKINRVTFNEITKDAVLKAFQHPRQVDMNLVNAQQARRFMDRIVGYNISPLLWKNVARGLSAGRVQSVALRLIVEREGEINKFIPQEYWTIEASLASQRKEEHRKVFHAALDQVDGKKPEINNEALATSLKDEIEKQEFVVNKIDKNERRRKPQAPYTTSKLQQEVFTRLHFPAQKTMRLAQSLYEGVELGDEGSVGLITYMRTDSVNVSKQALEDVTSYIKEHYGKDYLPDTPNTYKAKARAQEAHEAIRPTSAHRTPEQARPTEARKESNRPARSGTRTEAIAGVPDRPRRTRRRLPKGRA